jgi:hypothetical protein
MVRAEPDFLTFLWWRSRRPMHREPKHRARRLNQTAVQLFSAVARCNPTKGFQSWAMTTSKLARPRSAKLASPSLGAQTSLMAPPPCGAGHKIPQKPRGRRFVARCRSSAATAAIIRRRKNSFIWWGAATPKPGRRRRTARALLRKSLKSQASHWMNSPHF